MSLATLHTVTPNEVLFGFNLPPDVNMHLQRAASRVSSRADAQQALDEALECAPDQLEVLMALCKFHFYQGHLELAHDLAHQSIVKAALQGGFSHHWQQLDEHSTDWRDPRSPGRAFLYSLKALAFIYLRQEHLIAAQEVLEALYRLDPHDQVGAEVIRDLLRGLQDEDNG